ncbi:hypothetical protein GW17_00044034 [Ensete ventricosum]|nr:hypothetical protein GW17_00044034 [Ensete ventricosum]RZS17501.1 hypothetical protein BHM03_00049649 [Ensete ventricosum]
MSSATLPPPPTTASFSSSFLLPHPIQIPFNTTRRRGLLLRDSSKRFRALASLPDASEGARPEYTPWLIAGLGNPGNRYQGTRHNVSFASTHSFLASTVGYEMIDRICRAERITLNTIQSKALIGIGKQIHTILFCGATCCILSSAIATYSTRKLILIYDEMSLPNGVLRLQRKGGHGHHNGLVTLKNPM